ncbi:MAG: copper chaperone PCu(A)C [Sphingomonas sp.]|nr:copper chaperone PCu(A)C [Sphingomonas sp.]
MRRIVLTFLLALGGCDGPAPRIEVRDAWTRATSAASSGAAVYMTIANQGGEDRLTSATTSAARAATLHTMTMDGSIMRMRPIAGIEVADNGTLTLAPNGTHVMLTGLKRPLVEGERIAARLRFARSGDRDVAITVVGAGAR